MTEAKHPIVPIKSTRNIQLAQIAAASCALMLMTACKPKPVEQTAPAAQIEAPVPQQASVDTAPQNNAPMASSTPKAKPEPAPSVPTAAGGKASSIAGGWVNAGGACDSGASVQFNPDGTYLSEGENGTWALEGKTLTVTTNTLSDAETPAQIGPEQSTGDSGEKAVLTVLSVTDTSASVILSNGSNARWTRCSG
jgi:hypothetical protein